MDRKLTLAFLILVTLAAGALCLWILRPFLQPMLAAVFTGIAFAPVHGWLRSRLVGDNRSALAAAILVMLTVVVPVFLLAVVMSSDLERFYKSVQQYISGGAAQLTLDSLHSRLPEVVRQRLAAQNMDLAGSVGQYVETVARYLLARLGNIAGSVGSFFVTAILTLFILFFVFRDGRNWLRKLAALTPLTLEQWQRLENTVEHTMKGNVYGLLAVAVAQGLLTSITFVILGLGSPVLWGVVAGFASVLPAFGAGLVWLPAAVILMATGHVLKGLLLVGIGAGIISSADNVIRPLVIQGRVPMGTLTILFAILGGVQAFGLIGLFIGPVIFALAVELFAMLREEFTARRTSIPA